MKTVLHTLTPFCFLLILISCNNKDTKEEPKVKTETCIRYWYKLGKPDEKSGDSTVTIYNEFGNPIEERSSSNKKIFTYERDTLLVSETQYGLRDNSIWYKKNITYNEKGLKESLKIYTSFTTSKNPELVAGMKFFYNSDGKVIEKKYFGGIEYNEEEIPQTISSNPNGPDQIERENKRKADSSSATYIRNQAGKPLKIYFNNDTSNCIIFTYKGDLLVSKERKQTFLGLSLNLHDIILNNNRQPLDSLKKKPHFTGTRFYYDGQKLVKSEEFSNGNITKIKIYNGDKKLTESKQFFTDDEPSWRFTYSYDNNNKLKEIIKYNDINEPEFVDRFTYEFY